MEAFLKYRPSDALKKNHLIKTGSKLPTATIKTGYNSTLKDYAVQVDLTNLTETQRATLIAVGGDKGDSYVCELPGVPSVSTSSDAPHLWWDSAKQRQWDFVPTADQWIAQAERDLAMATPLSSALAEARRDWFAKETQRVAKNIATAEKSWSGNLQIFPINDKALAILRDTGIDTSAYDAMIQTWDETTYPELVRSRKEAKDARGRSEEERAAAAEAEKERIAAEKLTWCATHGSNHLRTAVAAGYDCQRLYVTERAATEHPSYVVDFDDHAAWKDRSCPSPAALAEALKVGGKVVWLTATIRHEDDDYYHEPCEAVVIRTYLGKYDLIKTM